MKTIRKSCWLVRWDYSRLPGNRDELKHLRFPQFVGTIPAQFDEKSVERMLHPMLLSYAPLSVAQIVECGKSFSSGYPKFEKVKFCSDGIVTCVFDRLRLEARRVRNLEVVELESGDELLSWIEGRTYKHEVDSDGDPILGQEIEITPERRRELTILKRYRATPNNEEC